MSELDLWARDRVPDCATELVSVMEGGFRSAPYNDGYGYWTQGFGARTGINGKPVTRDTAPITRAQGEFMLQRDLGRAASLVMKAIDVPLANCQAAALIVLAFNLGDLDVQAQSLVKLVNDGLHQRAADRFQVYRNSAGKPSTGLRPRRWVEACFYLGEDARLSYQRAWSEIRTPDGWPVLPENRVPALARPQQITTPLRVVASATASATSTRQPAAALSEADRLNDAQLARLKST